MAVELLTTQMVAERLHVSVKTAASYMRKMPRVKLDKSYLVKATDFERWLNERIVIPHEEKPVVKVRQKRVLDERELFDEQGRIKRRGH